MKRVNVERMQRYIARNTPDEAMTRLDPMDIDVQDQYRTFVDRFVKKMRIKHGETDSVVDVQVFDELGEAPGEMSTIVRVKVRKNREK